MLLRLRRGTSRSIARKISMSPQMCVTSCAWSGVQVRAPGVLIRVLQ
jgi:hypothetical protein